MSLISYTLITAFMREDTAPRGLLDKIRSLGLCARCLVTRASEGFFESGDVASEKILVLSAGLPKKLEVIVPEADASRIIDLLDRELTDGIVTAVPAPVVFHRAGKRLIPNHLQVRHVMTTDVATTGADTLLAEAARALVSAGLVSLPVTDPAGKVIGVLSQRDIFNTGYLSIRAGLFTSFDEEHAGQVLAPLEGKTVADVMTSPAVTIPEDTYLPDALKLLEKNGLKRLPAVDSTGCLTGVFGRLDILKAITRHTPGWIAEPAPHVDLRSARTLSDVAGFSDAAIPQTASLRDLLERVITTGLCCIPVVDDDRRLVGAVFDRNLVEHLAGHRQGLWELVTGTVSLEGIGKRHSSLAEALRETRVEEIMEKDVPSLSPGTPIEDAVKAMAGSEQRYLSVTDDQGRFLGLVGRTALLLGSTADV